MNLETVNLVVSERVARIELNRPDKANAMKTEARVAVISGRGKYFTSGIDLDMLAGLRQQMQDDCDGRSSERLRRTILDLQDTLSSIERCRKPVIAEIHGACIGGGIDLITCCDMRYAAADAYFSVKEIDVGMTADVGTLQRLPKLVPDGIVRELAYTGRRFDADEAKAIGLVNNVYQTPEAARRCRGNRRYHCREVAAVDPRHQGDDPLLARPFGGRRFELRRHMERRDADVGRSRRGDDRGEREAGAKIPGLARVRRAQPTTASTVGNFALLCSTLTRLSTSLACRGVPCKLLIFNGITFRPAPTDSSARRGRQIGHGWRLPEVRANNPESGR